MTAQPRWEPLVRHDGRAARAPADDEEDDCDGSSAESEITI